MSDDQKERNRQAALASSRRWYARNRKTENARARAWRAANSDKVSTYNKQYYANDIENQRERAKHWYKLNPIKAAAKSKSYKTANKSTVKQQGKMWRAVNPGYSSTWSKNNPGKMAEYNRVWRKRHPYKVKLSDLRRRQRKANANGVATDIQIEARVAFFGGCCSYCPGPYEHLDHAIPLARGGTNWPANLRPACQTCNLSKGTRTAQEFIASRRSAS